MIIQVFILLLFCLISTNQQNEIKRILQNVSREAKSIQTLSYESQFQMITSTREDSIYKSTGKIWLQLLPNDTIFGCRFHLQGEDKSDRFDYYYDGQKSFEVRHNKHIITIFDPYAFPNNNNNPAKARMALFPFHFNSFLIDTSLFHTLGNNAVNMTLLSESQHGKCAIAFYYEDAYGKDTKILFIDTSTFYIKKIETISSFAGTTQTMAVEVSKYNKNDTSQLSNVYLNNQYEGYKKEFVLAKDTSSHKTKRNSLIGKKAPLFSAPSCSGKTISLGQIEGKIVLLDFWESWCGYCLLALPKLNEFQQKYLKNNVQVIGVSSENRPIIKKLIEYNKLSYENVFVDLKVISKYNISARPTYVLINRDGRVAEVSEGDLEKIEKSLQKIIK